jgi:hypothetical protein
MTQKNSKYGDIFRKREYYFLKSSQKFFFFPHFDKFLHPKKKLCLQYWNINFFLNSSSQTLNACKNTKMIIMLWFNFPFFFLILQVFVILTKHYIIEMLLKAIFIFVECWCVTFWKCIIILSNGHSLKLLVNKKIQSICNYIFSSHNIQNLISIINTSFLLYDLHCQ